jgi:glycosyltransferase involved in cell wall biosynthesis
MKNGEDFQLFLKQALEQQLTEAADNLGAGTLKIDLHCHDHNSNVPDETLGRILGVPETWLPTSRLLDILKTAGMSVQTVTNHNNARSCWELMERGCDVLPAAEFSCTVPDLDIGVHVLTYGFSPDQESRLQELRKDLYDFLEYTSDHNLPTVLAHPLDFYAPRMMPELEKYEKILLLFNNFEVLNGQRDTYSNLLTWKWINSANEEKVFDLEKKFSFKASTFCREPLRKRAVGGSDDHFGVFAGRTGTLIGTGHLTRQQLLTLKPSEIALSALREGNIAPFGEWNDGRKLNLALLDYFAGLVLNMKDPGLGRILLHKGTHWQKISALAICNSIHEMRRHRYTMRFIKTFHEAVRGQQPRVMTRFLMRRYQPQLLSVVQTIARASQDGIAHLETPIAEELFTIFARMLCERVQRKAEMVGQNPALQFSSLDEFVEKFELPSVMRLLVAPAERSKRSFPALGEVFDGLSFPFLAATLVAGSMFASARILHGKRSFSEELAERFPNLQRPQRILWLTDTFADKNGVSSVLQLVQKFALERQLPFDFLVCHESLSSDSNLKVVRPLSSFSLPFYKQQPFRIQNLAEIQSFVEAGGYSAVICSTEGPMTTAALYLKHALNLPTYFYVHTDWLSFAQQNHVLKDVNIARVRRMMRALYSQFDGLFVLNSEQKRLFEGDSFQMKRVHQTAHWAAQDFRRMPQLRRSSVAGLKREDVVLLYAGRLSEEKGVFEIPAIAEAALHANKNVRIVFAGTGPAEDALRRLLPHAIFLGWQPQNKLAELYNRADLLLLPSTFDTFGCVVLEAMSCGLPVCAYAVKGPADIIDHGVNGFLARNRQEFCGAVALFAAEPNEYESMRKQAYLRSQHYCAERIMKTMMRDMGVATNSLGLSDALNSDKVPVHQGANETAQSPEKVRDYIPKFSDSLGIYYPEQG